MSGSADAAAGRAPGRRSGDDPADAVPAAPGSPTARDGIDTPGEHSPPGSAGDPDEDGPPADDGEGGRYVPL